MSGQKDRLRGGEYRGRERRQMKEGRGQGILEKTWMKKGGVTERTEKIFLAPVMGEIHIKLFMSKVSCVIFLVYF